MLLYLGNKLSEHGNTPTSVETLGLKLEECAEKVVTGSSKKNKFLRLADMLWLIFHFRKQDPVVLIDTYSTSAFWFAYYSARVCSYFKLPYITILRGGDLPERLDRSKNECTFLFSKSFSNVAVSNYLKHEFEKRKLPVNIIHNYIEIDNYPFRERKFIHPNILWVRAFHKIYNPELAIRIFAAIKKQYPTATLTMVGPDKDGSLENCKTLAQNLNLSVNFTDKLSKKEWIDLSKAHDLFLNTTNVDNTPISVMEAMALGMPVLTTNAGGIPYLFENNREGIMVPPNDVDAFVNTINQLINNPDQIQSISHRARARASQWDWNHVKPEWCKLIKNASVK